MSDKIRPQHVARKAILYVRQSSAYQVNHNLESQRLQYAMQAAHVVSPAPARGVARLYFSSPRGVRELGRI
jgi:hypothetical protein